MYIYSVIALIGYQHADEEPMEIGSDSHDIATVESKVQEHVDKHHPLVQSLVSAAYDEKQSIVAVKKCGTLDKAKEYLDRISNKEDQEEEEEFRKSSPPLVEDDTMQ